MSANQRRFLLNSRDEAEAALEELSDYGTDWKKLNEYLILLSTGEIDREQFGILCEALMDSCYASSIDRKETEGEDAENLPSYFSKDAS